MPNPGNYNLPDDTNLIGIIKKLQTRVDDLEKLTRASATSIDGGVLEVKAINKVLLWAFGDLAKAGIVDSVNHQPLKNPDGSIQMGVCAFRDSGELMFSAVNMSPSTQNKQNWTLWDVGGHTIMCDDVVSGQGLARPYIPLAFLPADTTVWGATQSATFADMASSSFNSQHPKLYLDALMYCDAGTTGQMRLTMNGTAFGPTISGGAGYTLYAPNTQAFPALSWGTYNLLTIQACRTGGTGNVKIGVRGAWGMQS